MKGKLLGALTALLVLGAAMATTAAAGTPSRSGGARPARVVQARTAYVEAHRTGRVHWTKKPPVMSAEQVARLRRLALRRMAEPAIPTDRAPAGPTAGTATRPALAPPSIFSNTTPNPVIPSNRKSTIDETSGGMVGNVRFMTGNWYAARSNNGGSTWSHVNPFTLFPSQPGGFCCDQVVLYEPSRNMMIWLLQYIKTGSQSSDFGIQRLAIYRNASAGINASGWIYYDFRPSRVGGPASGEWLDYPHLALSSNYLWWTTNVFTTTTDRFTRSVILRLPLDPLRAGQSFSYNYYSQSQVGTLTPVQGATGTQYIASHVDNNTIRIFKWGEASTSISIFNKDHPAYLSGTQHDCPTLDGQDWCERSDNRILAGSRSFNTEAGRYELRYFWNVAEGSGFTWPYIDAASFVESTLAFANRPYIFNQNHAWHYAAAAPNASGHTGLAAFAGVGTNRSPSYVACLDDTTNPTPPPWDCVVVRNSTNGPSNNAWGDYLAVRRAYPSSVRFMSTGWTLEGGKTGANVRPWFTIFGRS